jgi:hypothetical protein
MQTHRDDDVATHWLKSLAAKAEKMVEERQSEIAGGKPDEEVLDAWSRSGMSVRQLPADEHDILRISVGGGTNTPISLDYCVFRGDRVECIVLLRKALKALRRPPTKEDP